MLVSLSQCSKYPWQRLKVKRSGQYMVKPMGIPFGCNFNSFRGAFRCALSSHTCKIVISAFHYDDPFARNPHARIYTHTRAHTHTYTHIIFTHTHILASYAVFSKLREIMIALWREIMTFRIFPVSNTRYLFN